MKKENRKFAQDIYGLLVAEFDGEIWMPWIPAAIAVIESGWGKAGHLRKTHNPFGITPDGDQPFLVYLGSKIRIFPNTSWACTAWRYLLECSERYDGIRPSMPTPQPVITGNKIAYMGWGRTFVRKYCPENPGYPNLLATIMGEIFTATVGKALKTPIRVARTNEGETNHGKSST